MALHRLKRIICFLTASLLLTGPVAAAADEEPTLEQCEDAMREARSLANALPAEHLSRYFAERFLSQAEAEKNNREYDDCLEFAEQATLEITELRHVLQPGETLKVLRTDELPPPETQNK